MRRAYTGPQCPHCAMPLADRGDAAEVTEAGGGFRVRCRRCRTLFDATFFSPPQPEAARHADALPDGASCVLHANNAAVMACSRCGAFACDLCRVESAGGACCVTCFDRRSTASVVDGVAMRAFDYPSLAWSLAILSVLTPCLFIFGIAAAATAVAGLVAQRRSPERHTASLVGALAVGLVPPLAYLAFAIVVASQ